MKQSKIMSWSAAAFIVGFGAALLAPLLYVVAIGKAEAALNLAPWNVQLFEVTSHASGAFNISYGTGTVIAPAVLSLAIWAALSAFGGRKAAR